MATLTVPILIDFTTREITFPHIVSPSSGTDTITFVVEVLHDDTDGVPPGDAWTNGNYGYLSFTDGSTFRAFLLPTPSTANGQDVSLPADAAAGAAGDFYFVWSLPVSTFWTFTSTDATFYSTDPGFEYVYNSTFGGSTPFTRIVGTPTVLDARDGPKLILPNPPVAMTFMPGTALIGTALHWIRPNVPSSLELAVSSPGADVISSTVIQPVYDGLFELPYYSGNSVNIPITPDTLPEEVTFIDTGTLTTSTPFTPSPRATLIVIS